MAPFRADFGAGREEELDFRVGENDSAHIASFGDESGLTAKIPLPGQQGLAHFGQGRDAACQFINLRGADCGTYVLAIQPYLPARVELHRQFRRERRNPGAVVRIDAASMGGKREYAIQGAAVEQMKSQLRGHPPGDGPLAGGRRSVESDDRRLAHGAVSGTGSVSVISSPALRARAAKPGNEVATFAQLRIVTASRQRKPATAKAMAMRWSP